MPAGRPSKYYPEIIDELIEWFDQEPYEDVEIPHYGKNKELKWIDIKRMPKPLPTMVNFARHVKIGLRTLYDWIDEKHSSYKPEFSQVYTHVAKDLQKDFIVQNGLQGLNNPLFAKFVAINFTDMQDKQVIEDKRTEEIPVDEAKKIKELAQEIAKKRDRLTLVKGKKAQDTGKVKAG